MDIVSVISSPMTPLKTKAELSAMVVYVKNICGKLYEKNSYILKIATPCPNNQGVAKKDY